MKRQAGPSGSTLAPTSRQRLRPRVPITMPREVDESKPGVISLPRKPRARQKPRLSADRGNRRAERKKKRGLLPRGHNSPRISLYPCSLKANYSTTARRWVTNALRTTRSTFAFHPVSRHKEKPPAYHRKAVQSHTRRISSLASIVNAFVERQFRRQANPRFGVSQKRPTTSQ